VNSWALVAASLLVIVAGGFYLRSLRSPGLPEISGEERVLRSVSLTAIAPTGEISLTPEYFEWKAAGNAQSYRVTVRDVSGDRLWSGETQTTRLAFPAELRSQLLPGKTLTWQVEALAEGKTVAASGAIPFLLRLEQ
jgi:hypothetical protein